MIRFRGGTFLHWVKGSSFSSEIGGYIVLVKLSRRKQVQRKWNRYTKRIRDEGNHVVFESLRLLLLCFFPLGLIVMSLDSSFSPPWMSLTLYSLYP